MNRRFRDGLSFGFNDTLGLSDKGSLASRLEHPSPGVYRVRTDDEKYQALLGNNNPLAHVMKANFVWDLPDLRSTQPTLRAIGLVLNDWQFSGVWTGATGSAYTVGYTYTSGGSSVNLTGSPDYGARIRLLSGQDPGSGCSADVYRQFNTSAFAGPVTGSDGLESGNGYLRGCFANTFDLSIARNIRLGGARNLQLRVDMFNAPNVAGITARNTTLQLSNPTDPTTVANLPFDASGALITTRSQPRTAGLGVATNYQAARSIQAQVRFSF